jgi:hypothetical protein
MHGASWGVRPAKAVRTFCVSSCPVLKLDRALGSAPLPALLTARETRAPPLPPVPAPPPSVTPEARREGPKLPPPRAGVKPRPAAGAGEPVPDAPALAPSLPFAAPESLAATLAPAAPPPTLPPFADLRRA